MPAKSPAKEKMSSQLSVIWAVWNTNTQDANYYFQEIDFVKKK